MKKHRQSSLPIIFCGSVLAALFSMAKSTHAAEGWYLSSSQIALLPANRYFSSLDVVNDTNEPIYIRSSIDRLSLKDGDRVRTPDTDQSLTVSPDEFVLPPMSTVVVRVFARTGPQADSKNQSFYVNLEDVSRTQTLREGTNTGFVLAYDFLVSVAPSIDPVPQSKDFKIARITDAKYRFTNNSGRHIFLEGGYVCANSSQPLVQCENLSKFPKQSLLPLESLVFDAASSMEFFGFIAYDNLNSSGGQRAHVQPVTPETR